MLTSSFTGWNNYMRNLGDVVKDPEAMKHFGSTMVVWNLKTMKPTQVLSVPGAPLEIRWALGARAELGDHGGGAHFQDVADQAGLEGHVDCEGGRHDRRSRQDTAAGRYLDLGRWQGLWVNTFMDGMTHYFDLTDPEHPKETYQKHTGQQVNMVSQSWDGKRVYITSSLLSKWDKAGEDNEQVLRGYRWDGKSLTKAFEVDFTKEKLGGLIT